MTATAAPSALPGEQVIARRIVARAIDDGVLVTVALGIAILVARLFGEDPDVLQLMATFGFDPTAPPPSVAALAVFLLLGATVAFSLGVSALGGRSLGRALAGVTVIGADHRTPASRVLFGRELLRLALTALVVGVAWPLRDAVATFAEKLDVDNDVAGVLLSFAAWIPIAVAAGLWIGATLVDAYGRAPHDRIAHTRVVAAARASRRER